MKEADDNSKLEDLAKISLDRLADSLDGETRSKIGEARRRALAQGSRRQPNFGAWVGAGIGSLAVAGLVLLVVFAVVPGKDVDSVLASEDIELLASGEDFEFYEQLEFYLWLEDEHPTKERRT